MAADGAGAAAGSIELASVYINLIPALKGAPAAISKAVSNATSSPVTQRASAALGSSIVSGISSAIRKATDIPAAVQALVSKVSSGVKAAGDAVRVVGEAISKTRTILGETGRYIAGTWGRVWTTITAPARDAVASAVSSVSGMASRIGSALSSAGPAVRGAFSTLATAARDNFIEPAVRMTADVGRRIGGSLSTAFSGAASRLSGVVAPAFSRISDIAQSVVPRVSSALNSIGPSISGALSRAAAGASSAVGAIKNGIDRTIPAVASAASRIKGVWSEAWAKMPQPVHNMVSGIGSAFQGIPGRLGSALQSARGAVGSAASAIGSTLSDAIGVGVKAAGVAMAGLGAVLASNLGDAISRADQLNNFPKVMANIGFSSDEAAEQIKRISSSLDGLPTSTDSIVRLSQSLAPLTGGLTSATDVSLALNNALLAGGASGTLASNAMEQYRQQLSVGKVDMMAWRSMTNAMPGQMDQLAKSLLGPTANSQKLYEAMKSGNVTFDDFNSALLKLNSEGMDGFASFEEQARSATGGIGTAVENVKNRIQRALATIIEAIGVENISGKINEWSKGFVDLGDKIASAITKIKEAGSLDDIKEKLSGLSPVFGLILGSLGPLLARIPLLGAVFSGLTAPVGLAIGSFVAMWQNSEHLRDSVSSAMETLGNVFNSPAISSGISYLSSSLRTAATVIGDSLGKAIDLVAPPLANMAERLFPILSKAIGDISVALAPIVGSILETLGRWLAVIIPFLTRIGEIIIPIIVRVVKDLAAFLGPVVDLLGGVFVEAFKIIAAVALPVIKALGAVFMWLWNHAVGPVLRWMGAKISEFSNYLQETAYPKAEAAIHKIGDAWNWLYENAVSPFIEWWTSTAWPFLEWGWNNLVTLAEWMWPKVVAAWGFITDAVAGFVDWWQNTAWPFLEWGWNNLVTLIDWLWPKVVAAWDMIWKIIQGFVLWWQDVAWPVIEATWNLLVSIAEKVGNFVTEAWNRITGAVEGFVNFLQNPAEGIIQGFYDLFVGGASNVEGATTLSWGNISSTIAGFASNMSGIWGPQINGAQSSIGTEAWSTASSVGGAYGGMGGSVAGFANNMSGFWAPQINGAQSGIGSQAWATSGALAGAYAGMGGSVAGFANNMSGFWAPTIRGAMSSISNQSWSTNSAVQSSWGSMRGALAGHSGWISGSLGPSIRGTFSGIGTSAWSMQATVANAFDRMRGDTARPVNFIIRTVYENGLKKLVNSAMESLGLDKRMSGGGGGIPGYASGGVLPGYSPGRDIYHFTSTDGGGRLALSGGEAIMRPEWVKAVGGPRMVNAMNAAASSGHRIPGGDLGGKSYQAFAPGGIWEPLQSKFGTSVGSVSKWLSEASEAKSSLMLDPGGGMEALVKDPVKRLLDSYTGVKGAFWDMGRKAIELIMDGAKDWVVAHAPKPAAAGMMDGPVDMTGATDLPSAARKAIGTPYVWGGSSVPGGVDCSGLVYWAAKQLGWGWPRLTAAGYQAGSRRGSPMVPGHLLFWGNPAHHVAIASGGGRMIEAPTFGIPVREIGIYGGPSAGVYGYDNGGALQPGVTLAVNKTRQPETVVTGQQWKKLDRLVDAIENGALGGGRELVIVDADRELIGRMQTEAVGAIVEYDRLNN